MLPHLSRRDIRLLAHEGDEDEDAELTRLRLQVREWRAEAARKGQPLRLPFMPFFLRNIWSGALLLFTVITFSTFFITKVWQVSFSCSRTTKTSLSDHSTVAYTGNYRRRVGRYMLGCRMLGSFRDYHGVPEGTGK